MRALSRRLALLFVLLTCSTAGLVGGDLPVFARSRLQPLVRQLDETARDAREAAARPFGDHGFARLVREFAGQVDAVRQRLERGDTTADRLREDLQALTDESLKIDRALAHTRRLDVRTTLAWQRVTSLLDELRGRYVEAMGLVPLPAATSGVSGERGTTGVDQQTPGPSAAGTDLRTLARSISSRAADLARVVQREELPFPRLYEFRDEVRVFEQGLGARNAAQRGGIGLEVDHLLKEARDVRANLAMREAPSEIRSAWDDIVSDLERLRELATPRQ